MEDQAYSPPSTTKSYSCFQPPEVSLSLNLLRLWSQLLFYPNCAKKVLTGASVWDRKCDVWCLGALLLEWNLENYMWDIIGHWFMMSTSTSFCRWDSQCIDRAKSNYVSNASNGKKQEPIRWLLNQSQSIKETVDKMKSNYTVSNWQKPFKKRPQARNIRRNYV